MNNFQKIDLITWKRTPYFKRYFNDLRCTYSLNSRLDITTLLPILKERGFKLYPVLIYALTKIVNKHDEFRTCFNAKGELGIWDCMHPSYTIFHKESETFSEMWSYSEEELVDFLANYEQDMADFGDVEGIFSKEKQCENTFPISSLPWRTFTGFNINIFSEGTYLLPVFTWGKYEIISMEGQQKIEIPLSVQVHHAVCDGFHLSRFLNELQEVLMSV